MLSSVVLPHPEGPVMAMNSPFRTSIFTFCNAFVSTVSERKLLLMFSNRIIVLLFRSNIIVSPHHRIIALIRTSTELLPLPGHPAVRTFLLSQAPHCAALMWGKLHFARLVPPGLLKEAVLYNWGFSLQLLTSNC